MNDGGIETEEIEFRYRDGLVIFAVEIMERRSTDNEF